MQPVVVGDNEPTPDDVTVAHAEREVVCEGEDVRYTTELGESVTLRDEVTLCVSDRVIECVTELQLDTDGVLFVVRVGLRTPDGVWVTLTQEDEL